MFDIMEGADPKEAAKKWIENNEEKVTEWSKGVK